VVFDRQARTTTLVSDAPIVGKVPPSSSHPTISDDGRYVAYETGPDINLWDATVDQTQRLTIASDGTKVNGASHAPSMSATAGSWRSRRSRRTSSSPVARTGPTGQVFMWQRSTGGISLVSVAGDRAAAGEQHPRPTSLATGASSPSPRQPQTLFQQTRTRPRDVFLRDVSRGVTIRASVKSAGGQVAQESRRPSISGDGAAVVFDSTAIQSRRAGHEQGP
jgi:hypothetical protein